MVFRSMLVPIKAALGYLLSVAAAFGVVVAVFEWGWFADLLHVDKAGPIISFMPIILMGVLFGLAMDYEVFLVSRHARGLRHAGHAPATPTRARSARLRSGFTARLASSRPPRSSCSPSSPRSCPRATGRIKPIALGLAVGIAIDAFLVRMTLVPAVMALLGDKAWWMPQWLDRVLPHFDIEGEAVERELALADWPEPDTTAAVVAEDARVSPTAISTCSSTPHLRVEPRRDAHRDRR